MAPTAEHWERMSASERGLASRRLLSELPAGFAFESVRPFHFAGRQHPVALFRFQGAQFALVPGGRVTLGFDVGRWQPTAEELQSWEAFAAGCDLGRSLEDHLREVMLPRRELALAPFLIETSSAELGWELISAEEPDVQDILRRYPARTPVELHRSESSIRVQKHEDGRIVAERSLGQTHAQAAELLRRMGFRFPTPDEWEYACGRGEPTLFRWGDHAPCDRYPTDISPAEARWRREWVMSGGTLEYPPEGFVSDWDQHRRPNAFGLFIASDPYKYELTAEIGSTRGGDGGSAVCGGAGFFVGWLALATAYFEEHACHHDPEEPISPGFTMGRRVLPLG